MKSIFKWFTLEDASARIVWFATRFTHEEFEGVDRMLAIYLDYCAKLDIVATRRYLESFMRTEGRKNMVKHNVRVSAIDNFDYNEPTSLEEAFQVMLTAVYAAYDEYTRLEIQDDSFKVAMKTFMSTKKSELTLKIMAAAFPKLSSGGDTDETITDMQYKLDRLQLLYDDAYLDKLDFLEGKPVASGSSSTFMRKICSTGIPCIDADAGGVYSSQVWAFTGSPGSGKTRFAMATFVYHALTVEKIDVLVDELELQVAEINNMLIAIHIINLYGGKVKIPDSVMNKNEMTSEQRRYYESARIDLFESGKYGKLILRTDDLVVENLRKEMYTFLRRNRNVGLWVIDYAGLAKSVPVDKYSPHMNGYEIIQELYKGVKEICKVTGVGAVIINQFNREGVAAAYAGKRILAGHIEGGQIIERHSDYDIVMCMTEDQEVAHRRTLSTVKKRAAAGFWNVPFIVDLSVSIFKQIKDDAA